jgi:hypothetical protein
MRKKLVLQRNLRKGGGQSYLKYLVISAVCLIFLVLITDHYFKGKTKDLSKPRLPERGVITKEVPRQLEPPAPEAPSELAKPAEPVRPPETRQPGAETESEGTKTSEIQPASQPPAPSPAVPQRPSALEAPSEGRASKSDEAAPKDLFPKKGARPQSPAATAVKAPAKTTAKVDVQAPQAKPAPSTVKGDYAIQVGAVFKDKSQAESLRKDLATKGYRAVIGPAADGCCYVVTTSPCPQSKAYTLLEQMRIQGLNNAKIIKVAPTHPPAPKPAPQ